jgi:hypothetical protein
LLPHLVVEVGRTLVQDFRLEVGEITDTVSVVAEVPSIERSLAVGQIFDRATIDDLPLNGRYVLQLALLVPGSVTPPQNGFLTTPSRAQGSQAVNTMGHREDTANFQVNGVTLNDQINNILMFQPPIDAVQEFRIDTSSSPAENGRNSGASLNIVTRSGTNRWQGGIFEFASTTRSTPATPSRWRNLRSSVTSLADTLAAPWPETAPSPSQHTKACAKTRACRPTASYRATRSARRSRIPW